MRKVADFGSGVVRKVAEFAGPVGGVAASIADMVGRPDVGAAILKGAGWLQKYGLQAERVLEKASGVGGKMKDFSGHLLGS